jgi:hypothetical protein
LRSRVVSAGLALALLVAGVAAGQESADSDRPRPPEGSRIINLPSADAPPGGTLGVLFTHRFKNPLNSSSARDLFTLDSGANTVLGVSYSPWDRLEIALDRSSEDADFELAAKYQFLAIEAKRPFAVALRVGGNAVTAENVENREAFFAQAIASFAIGRSIRVTAIPTYVSNTALFRDVFNVPVALSVAITRTVNLHGEVYPKNRDFTEDPKLPGRQTHIGWIASIEKTVLRHRFAFTVGNMRGTAVDQYTGSDIGGVGVPHDVFLGFNLVRQWKLK